MSRHAEAAFERFDEGRPALQPMAPAEALAYFRSLVPTLKLPEEEWTAEQYRTAFTTTLATEQTLLEKIKGLILQTLETGEKVRATPQAIEELLDAAGVSPRNPQHAEMLTRTSLMDAYNTGAERERMHPDVVDHFPAWQYLGIRDGRQGKDHEPHFDQFFPAHVAFADVRGERIYNCRCVPRAVHRSEWRRLQEAGHTFARFAEHDVSDEARDEAGRWTAGGAGAPGGAAENAAKAADVKAEKSLHEAWQARDEARDRTASAVDAVTDWGDLPEQFLASGVAWSKADDALRAGTESVDAGVAAKAHVALLASAWDAAEARVQAAGLTANEAGPFRKAKERAIVALTKKADAYAAQAGKLGAAHETLAGIEAAEPPGPVLEDYPAEPPAPNYPDDPAEDAPDADWDVYQAAVNRADAAHDKATEKYEAAVEKIDTAHEKAHDKWQAIYERAYDRVETEKDRLLERFGDLDDAANEADTTISEKVEDAQEAATSRLGKEEEADPEPDEDEEEDKPDEPDEDEA